MDTELEQLVDTRMDGLAGTDDEKGDYSYAPVPWVTLLTFIFLRPGPYY